MLVHLGLPQWQMRWGNTSKPFSCKEIQLFQPHPKLTSLNRTILLQCNIPFSRFTLMGPARMRFYEIQLIPVKSNEINNKSIFLKRSPTFPGSPQWAQLLGLSSCSPYLRPTFSNHLENKRIKIHLPRFVKMFAMVLMVVEIMVMIWIQTTWRTRGSRSTHPGLWKCSSLKSQDKIKKHGLIIMKSNSLHKNFHFYNFH